MSKIASVPDGQVMVPSGSVRAATDAAGFLCGAGFFVFFAFFFGGAAVLVLALALGFVFGLGFFAGAMPQAYAYSMSPFSMT